MYGNLPKSDAMKKADEVFIAGVLQMGFTREVGSGHSMKSGWYSFRKGDHATAVKRFNQAWLLDPENGDAYYGFALITAVRDGAPSDIEKFFHMAFERAFGIDFLIVRPYIRIGRIGHDTPSTRQIRSRRHPLVDDMFPACARESVVWPDGRIVSSSAHPRGEEPESVLGYFSVKTNAMHKSTLRSAIYLHLTTQGRIEPS